MRRISIENPNLPMSGQDYLCHCRDSNPDDLLSSEVSDALDELFDAISGMKSPIKEEAFVRGIVIINNLWPKKPSDRAIRGSA